MLKKKIFVSGIFEVLHPGHLRLLRFSKELGGKLVVGVFGDNLSKSRFFSQQERAAAVSQCMWVDEVVLIENNLNETISDIKPDIIVKGSEYKDQINEEKEIASLWGGKVIFCSGEPIFSSIDALFNKSDPLVVDQDAVSKFVKSEGIDLTKITKLVQGFKRLRVTVIGETIVDKYISCEALGMSREDPTICVSPFDQTKFIGGAGIVAKHACNLGADVNFFSVIGKDEAGSFVKNSFKDSLIKNFIVEDEARPTILKTRYRVDGKTLLRVNELRSNNIGELWEEHIFKALKPALKNSDILIFSDFNYGLLTENLIAKIMNYIEKNVFVAVDSQSSSQNGNITRYKNVSFVSATEYEARIGLRDYESGLAVVMNKLIAETSAKYGFLKMGAEGVLGQEMKGSRLYQLQSLNKFLIQDTAGAGDSMLISASMALTCGANVSEALLIGSICAAKQISRLGNIPIGFDELCTQLQQIKV
jgi:rfaE bifunctional protein kinase chain/domain